MCTELLPPGGYPIAVKYISYHFIASLKRKATSLHIKHGSAGSSLRSHAQGQDKSDSLYKYNYTQLWLKKKSKVHPCTVTVALYRPYDP
jgi:hypothetical protein